MKHMLVTGQQMQQEGNHLFPGNGRYSVRVIHDDWAIVQYAYEYRLCAIIGQFRLTLATGARLKHGPVLIGNDLSGTWAELQDFRFIQTSVTGKEGEWLISRWIRENLDPEYLAKYQTTPLYGASLKRCIIKGRAIDLMEQCV